MRCHDAAALALVSNNNYAHIEWAREIARGCARREFEKSGICRYLIDIPIEDARSVLQDNLGKIIRSQRPSGGWRINDSRRLTYFYLRAFIHCRMDEEIRPRLKRDPVAFLVAEDDLLSLAAQQRFQGLKVLQGERQTLAAPVLREQLPNGSWENTVIATAHHLELLSEACMDSSHEAIQKAIGYLFSSLQPDVLSETRGMKGMAVARDMFSGHSRDKEFQSASKYKQEWNPVSACYKHIPNIQNSYALRLLHSLGFQNDERVLRACDNLVALQTSYGGFCETNLRISILGK